MSDLSRPEFLDPNKAREWLETELWPVGPICPHCGVINAATLIRGKSHRPGLYQCNACREPFTVTVGTLYERSKIPLNKWLVATHLMMASKKGMSALEIGRLLGLSKKTAWFLCHRIRESLRDTQPEIQLGGKGKVVEADETYVGGKESNKHKSKRRNGMQGGKGKEAVVALVEREGRVRSHHVASVSAKNLKPILQAQIDRKSYLMTDESAVYLPIGEAFAGHETVNHSIEEYVRSGGFWHTNTVESYFSIFKRGVYGTFHHVSQQHLKRYLAEFDFRYNEREALGVSDAARMAKSVQGIVGKRLTYRRTRGGTQAQEARAS
jgi:transposase-like protein